MNDGEEANYERIEEAIKYINANFKAQPDLETIAAHVHLSPFHFQRLFTEWAGVSPKRFLQYLSIDHAKMLLAQQATLIDASIESGLSGTGRLHDLFIKIEGMTPGEYKHGGAGLSINYSFAQSPFGNIIVGSTPKGICYLSFVGDEMSGFNQLKSAFPNAEFRPMIDVMQQNALLIFRQDWSQLTEVKLHLKGTAFQLKVWEALLKIPTGGLVTYGMLAKQLQHPGASRAVGTAIGNNPVAFLIPCHRVIQSTGQVGQYHWGANRKTAIIGWESALISSKA